MNCNATLTTLTATDNVVAHMPRQGIGTTPLYDSLIPDGSTVTRDGDELQRDDVTVVTCDGEHDAYKHDDHVNSGSQVVWTDKTPGATPHRDPMDELVAVSEKAGLYEDPCPDCDDGRVRCKADCIDRHPCPSCGGSGTQSSEAKSYAVEDCPAVTDGWREQMPVPDRRTAMDDVTDDMADDFVTGAASDDAARMTREQVVAGLTAALAAAPAPTVTDAEVEAGLAEYAEQTAAKSVAPAGSPAGNFQRSAMRAALEAAARARQENP